MKGGKEFLKLVEKFILHRLYELLNSVQNGTWKKVSEILIPFSPEVDKKWGLRFYLLLNELVRELALRIQPFNEDGNPSLFAEQFGKYKTKALIKEQNFYLGEKLSDFDGQDQKFFQSFPINLKKEPKE